MKTCALCQDTIPDDAAPSADDQGHCIICGRGLEARPEAVEVARNDVPVEVEPTDGERRRLEEVRRLQRIAYGPAPRSMQATKMKGLLALMIILCILVYTYTWNRHRKENAPPKRSEVTFRAFNVLFGPSSVLNEADKRDEFRHFRSSSVRWKGDIRYINRGSGDDLYVIVRHTATVPASDVLVRFDEASRDVVDDLKVGQTIRYAGKLTEFDRGTGLITLREGQIRP